MVKNIEYVCTGNKDRSPTAEAITKRELEIRGIGGIYVCSSGTLVAYPNSDLLFVKEIDHYLGPMIAKGIITDEEAEQLKKEKNPAALLRKFNEEQIKYRTAVLEEKGLIKYIADHKPTQTTIRPEAELILALSQKNLERIVKIYQPAQNKPRIDSLGEIFDPFLFPSYDKYKRTVEEIELAVLKAFEKYNIK